MFIDQTLFEIENGVTMTPQLCSMLSTLNFTWVLLALFYWLTLVPDRLKEMARGETLLSFFCDCGSMGPGLVLVSDA